VLYVILCDVCYCIDCILLYCTVLYCLVLHCNTLPPGINTFAVNNNNNNTYIHTYILSLRNISALLYVKLEFLEDGVRSIKASKTRRVYPNISVHFLPEKDNSTLSVQLPTNKEDLTCRFSLCTKPTFGEYPELPTAVYFQLLSRSSRLLTMETRPIILTYLSQFYQFCISQSISFTHITTKVKTV
jgi:hypothetical protein